MVRPPNKTMQRMGASRSGQWQFLYQWRLYNYVKAAVASTPGLKPVADQLGERFQRASAAKPPTPPA